MEHDNKISKSPPCIKRACWNNFLKKIDEFKESGCFWMYFITMITKFNMNSDVLGFMLSYAEKNGIVMISYASSCPHCAHDNEIPRENILNWETNAFCENCDQQYEYSKREVYNRMKVYFAWEDSSS